MAALITTPVPDQNYELIRERIGLILAEELTNQAILIPGFERPTVYVERLVSFNESEVPSINIMMSRGDYNNRDVKSVDGNYIFYIDCYTSASSSANVSGDKLAGVKLQKLMGMCRAILENPVYKTLAYPPPFLCARNVQSISVITPESGGDTASNAIGRLELYVRVPESVSLLTAPALSLSATSVLLGMNDEGYLYYAVQDGGIDTEDGLPVVTEDNIPLIPQGSQGDGVKISGLPDADSFTDASLITGLQGSSGSNANYSGAQLLVYILQNIPAAGQSDPIIWKGNGTDTYTGIPAGYEPFLISFSGQSYTDDEFAVSEDGVSVTLTGEDMIFPGGKTVVIQLKATL